MNLVKNKFFALLVFICVVSAIIVCFPVSGLSGQFQSNIKKITPPPAAGRHPDVQSREFFDYYFDQWGKLDEIGDGYLIINDRRFDCSSDLDSYGIRTGKYIGVHLNDAGEIEKVEKISSPPVR